MHSMKLLKSLVQVDRAIEKMNKTECPFNHILPGNTILAAWLVPKGALNKIQNLDEPMKSYWNSKEAYKTQIDYI